MTATCPTCGFAVDAAVDVETCAEMDPGPRPGDLSICAQCTALSRFTDDLTLRRLTPAELITLQLSNIWPRIAMAQLAAIAMRKEKTK